MRQNFCRLYVFGQSSEGMPRVSLWRLFGGASNSGTITVPSPDKLDEYFDPENGNIPAFMYQIPYTPSRATRAGVYAAISQPLTPEEATILSVPLESPSFIPLPNLTSPQSDIESIASSLPPFIKDSVGVSPLALQAQVPPLSLSRMHKSRMLSSQILPYDFVPLSLLSIISSLISSNGLIPACYPHTFLFHSSSYSARLYPRLFLEVPFVNPNTQSTANFIRGLSILRFGLFYPLL